MKNKVVSADEALAIVRDGDTVAVSGFVGSGTPDELIAALERRFRSTASPRELTLVFAATELRTFLVLRLQSCRSRLEPFHNSRRTRLYAASRRAVRARPTVTKPGSGVVGVLRLS